MKRIISCITIAAAAASVAAVPAFAGEAAEYVYGTMNIPYEQFYAAEGASGVDAVSSATQSKWKNAELAAGTYYEAHTEDQGGDILGVIYPVAITSADLAALGDENYAFTAAEETPAAYKIVSVTDGQAEFSAVQAESQALEASFDFLTDSRYGDYEIDVMSINNKGGTSDIGTVAGVLITTEDGSVYALRHLENIWQDKLSWSCGIKTEEAHGNTLSSEQYKDMMGKTISAVTYITDQGYFVLDTEGLYVPVKFEGSAEAAGVPAADGQSTVVLTGFPEDFEAQYGVEGLEITEKDGVISWESAYAGAYTLTVSDAAGKYADVTSSFVLTTDQLPVVYDAEQKAVAAAEGAEEGAVSAYFANITSVSVNETAYTAAGKGAVVILTEDGTIDAAAAKKEGRGEDAVSTPVFPEAGEYEITVTASGYETPLTFTYIAE